jgi:hypothetical protein
VLAFAKKFGIFGGAGNRQRFDNLDRNFNTMKEANDYGLHLPPNMLVGDEFGLVITEQALDAMPLRLIRAHLIRAQL